MFEKITEAEINQRSMANVSTTPNRPTAFGESNMDAQALKLRFDRLSRYLAGRINEIFEALDEGTFAHAVYINHEGRKVNLETFITNLLTGDVDDIQIQTTDGIVYLTELGNKVQEMYNGQATGDLAGNITIVDGVTLKKFYEDFLEMENQGQGEPGKSAYDYAVEGGYQGTEEEFAKKLATEYPSKVSQLENDEKYITASGAPVQTVNGKAGNVSLSAADVGARPNTWTPTAYEVGAEPVNTVSTHNASDQAHNDIRIELRNLANKINDLLDSDDENLDELHEIVEYIKNNHTLISNITTSKVSVADIVNDLVTSLPNKPLSAAQGVALKALIDAITVPTKLSQLENDKGYITGYTESDPTVPEWAKATKKPGYTKEEIGLPNVDNVKQYSASNPPPYPVKSVNNKTGNVNLAAEDVGARPNTWTPTAADVGAEKSGNVAAHNTNTAAHNDIRLLIEGLSNRINAIFDSEDTDLDELSEIVAYIKSNKDLIDAITTSKVSISDIIDNLETSDSKKPLSAKQGVVLKALIDAITVPTKLSQLENDKKFITKSEAPVQTVNNKTGNVELGAEDVGARPDTWTPSASEVGARPDDWMPTAADVGARPNSWTPTASDVGARPATWMPSYSDVGAEKAGNVNTHNTNGAAHNDIRVLIASLSERINAVLDSDDATLDELSEIVAYIKANKTLIESVTTSKVNVSDIIDNLETPDPTKPLSAAQGVYIMGLLQQLVTEFGEALEAKANKEQGVFFIKGASGTAGTWTGTHPDITAYYDGLMIAYKIGVAGASTTTLNINGLGAVKVVKNASSAISTNFAVNSVIFLVYTVDGSTAYWKAHDYDANTRNSVGDYQKNNTKLYFVGTTTTDDATSSSYATSYTNSKVYVDANNVFNAESGFKGNLTGNADTATKATQDGNGNNIANTYETKANVTAKYYELANRIGEGTPVRGEDYWTPSDREEILAEANEFIADEIAKREQKTTKTAMSQEWLAENGDPEELYLLTDESDPLNGYFFAHKMSEVIKWHNALLDAKDLKSSGLFTNGYVNNYYVSDVNQTTESGCVATAFIPYAKKSDGSFPTIYIKGLSWETASSRWRCYVYTSTPTLIYGSSSILNMIGTNANLWTNFTVQNYTNGQWVDVASQTNTGTYWRLVPKAALSTNTSSQTVAYLRMSFGANSGGTGENLIISLDKPIESTYENTWSSTGLYLVDDGNSVQIAENKKNIASLNSRVSVLEAGGVSSEIESYVQEEAERVAKEAYSHQNANTFSFLAISDMHYSDNWANIVKSIIHAGQGMDLVRKGVNIDFAVCLGDNTWGSSVQPVITTQEMGIAEIRQANKYIDAAFRGIPNFRTIGNHDNLVYNYETNGAYLSGDDLFPLFGAYNRGAVYPENKAGGYCYRDFDEWKLRVICINTTEDTANNPADKANMYVSSAQLQWFANTLDLSAKSDATEWSILIFSHAPIEIVANSKMSYILEAYKNGGAIPNNGYVGQIADYNYSGKNKATVIGNIHGHNHNFQVDNLRKLIGANTTAAIPVKRMCVPNACYMRSNERGENEEVDHWDVEYGETTSYHKTANSAEDTAFNVITIDPVARKIFATNYGAGYDREIDY